MDAVTVRGPAMMHSNDDTLAFESRPSLFQWLAAHFDLPTPAY